MKRRAPSKPQSVARYLRVELREELQAWGTLVREQWQWFLLLAIAALLLLVYARPIPLGTVYLAAGQEGSSDWIIGTRLARQFQEQGIRLELVPTAGSARSLRDLADRDSKVSAALLQGGIVGKGETPGVVSLGSIQYAPLWLFYRGEEHAGEDPIDYLVDKRVAIGAPGSGTQNLLRKVQSLRGVNLDRSTRVLEPGHAEAARLLVAGEIDAMFIVDSINSPVVQQLLAEPGVHLFDFGLAPAYVKKLPFLDLVTVPRGSLDLRTIHPSNDIRMIASTTTLLVREDTHPAVQQLFMMAADEISSGKDQFFAKSEAFPAYTDHSIPVSPVAKRYFESGPPAFTHLLPLWLASFIDRAWLFVLAVVAIAVPVYNLRPSYRRLRSEIAMHQAYEELRELERRLVSTDDAQALEAIIRRLDGLYGELADTWLSSDDLDDLYFLKGNILMVREQAVARAAGLAAPRRDAAA